MQSRLALALTPVLGATLALLVGCTGGGGSSGGGHVSAASTTQTISTPTTVTPSPSPAPAVVPTASSGWQPLGLTNVVATVLAVDPANSQHVYAGTQSTLDVTWDGGAHWDDMGALLPGGAREVDAVVFDPRQPSTAYVFVGGTTPTLAKTTDDGQSFVALGVNLSGTLLGSIALDPTNSATVYVTATFPGAAPSPLVPMLWKSVDSGATFSPLAPAISGMAITVVVDPVTPLTVYMATAADVNAGKTGGLWKSVDGGVTFGIVGAAYLGNDPFFMSAISPQHQQVIALDPTHPATIYAGAQSAGGQGTFNVSTDGGVTWKGFSFNNVGADFFNGVIVDPRTPSTIYLYGGNGSGSGSTTVLKSKDAGVTWAPIESGFATGIAGLAGGLALAPSAPGTLYAGFPGAALYGTTTGGE